MKIIYHCYGGAHSSVTAASIHLGLLPADHVPGLKAFWEIPFYDRQENDEHGHIFFMGLDKAGNEIFFSACRGRPLVFENIFKSLAGIYKISPEEYLLVDVMKNVNWTMKLGGYLSRRCGFIRIGRPIVTLGTQAAYLQLVDLVRKVIKTIGGHSEENIILQRQQISSRRPGRRNSFRLPAGGERVGRQRIVEPPFYKYKQ